MQNAPYLLFFFFFPCMFSVLNSNQARRLPLLTVNHCKLDFRTCSGCVETDAISSHW